MPPADPRGPFARWRDSSRTTALAVVSAGTLREENERFRALDAGLGPWRWLTGPHARVRYESLGELLRGEAATLAPVPYLSRFQRGGQVVEVRLERLDAGEALAMLHDVTAELGRQRELQREREALLHEERMHAMGVLASGVAHDLNHALNVIALRVAMLRADPRLERSRRSLDVVARVVGDAARIVARLQDLARRRRDRPSDPLDLAAVLTGAVEMARTEADTAGVRIEADVPLAAPPRREPVRKAHAERRTQRILIIDDEEDNLEVLREVLELENQEVEAIRSGPEALALFDQGERFDLVLCDVGMPEVSGWHVAREIQRVAPGTAVWMLTGWANEIGESDPRRRYVRGVLAKPLNLERLRSLLVASPGPTAPQTNAEAMH